LGHARSRRVRDDQVRGPQSAEKILYSPRQSRCRGSPALCFSYGSPIQLYALHLRPLSGEQRSSFSNPGIQVPYVSAGDLTQLTDRELPDLVTHFRKNLLEDSCRKR